MKLTSVNIVGYRSINASVDIKIEDNVTIIVGANDHGKTNHLNALLHLNEGKQFSSETDLNWDHDDSASFPQVSATFQISKEKGAQLISRIRDEIGIDDEINTDALSSPILSEAIVELAQYFEEWKESSIPSEVTFTRQGCGPESIVYVMCERFLPAFVADLICEERPHFDLVAPINKIDDNVTFDELKRGKNKFMRGIFYYAGLDPFESETLFTQNNSTSMLLEKASRTLNDNLSKSWSQGGNLEFRLRHHSSTESIQLRIFDPHVSSSFVEPSKRSTGFTHYFALKTILHATQKRRSKNEIIFLFDEPGVSLHPSGQNDLLQVIESLSDESQIIYTTHSVFMINRTFPTRHRLVSKDAEKSSINGKPQSNRWERVLDALGLSLMGSALFTNRVILPEGDSDPTYLYSLLQKHVANGDIDADLNSLSILATGDTKNADALIRLTCGNCDTTKVLVLVDGDEGGKDRLKSLRKAKSLPSFEHHILEDGTELEDHLPMLEEIFVSAVYDYLREILSGSPEHNDLKFKDLLDDFKKTFPRPDEVTGVAKWVNKISLEKAGIKEPSKVGIARSYATALQNLPSEKFVGSKRSLELAVKIHSMLSLNSVRSRKAIITN